MKKKICTLALLSVLSFSLASCGKEETPTLPTLSTGQIEEAENFIFDLANRNVSHYTQAVNSEDIIGLAGSLNSTQEVKLYDLQDKVLKSQVMSSELEILANLDAKVLNGQEGVDRTTFYYSSTNIAESQSVVVQNYYNSTDGLKVVVNDVLDEESSSAPIEGGILSSYAEVFSQIKTIFNNGDMNSIEKLVGVANILQTLQKPSTSAVNSDLIDDATIQSAKNIFTYAYGYLIGQGEHTVEQENQVVIDFISLFEKLMGVQSGSLSKLKTTARAEILKLVSNMAYINFFKCFEINALDSSLTFKGETFKKELNTVLVFSKKELKKILNEMALILNPNAEISDKDLTEQVNLIIETLVTFAEYFDTLKLTLVNRSDYTTGIKYEFSYKTPYYEQSSSKLEPTGYIKAKQVMEFSFDLNDGLESIPTYKSKLA